MVTTVKRTLAAASISGFGAVAAMWLAALGPGTATAHADFRCDPVCHGTWCPGDPVWGQIRDLASRWDMNTCHEFHQISGWNYAEGPLPPGTFVCPPISFMCP
ncbi:hypothetical protein AWC29_20560 [Mycobacterium triplex]|uniref:Secreted protein n=1 Tax=Mycobacterium triplex TaxID=47839 RepID=A0A024JY89_9MYCO|nr:hypothetical protein [Mycobacterium triplex]ORX02238.1 hypothetical protein AWC29_20560 [Mycobacterium triplex]CDO88307.1 hypothetical protein BN973_02671 [Mycobacterium triplex]